MATQISDSRGTGTALPAPRNLTLALVVIAVAQLMVILDATIVNVSLPTIQRALHFSPTGLEWVINAYTLAFGGLLLLGGRAGDLLGRRRMFITGLLVFSLGSLAGGFAMNSAWLIAARAAQGVGGAIVAPTVLSLIADTFPEGAQRNRAMGIYAMMAGAGGAIGLLAGGIITTYLTWRWVLFVNVPIGLLVAFVAPRVLAMGRVQPGRFDFPGALTGTVGLTTLVYGFNHAASYGWSDTVTIGALAAAAVLLATFIVIETRTQQPLMPLRIFSQRNRSGSYGLALMMGVAMFGMFFFLTLFVQTILHYSPVRAGLAFLPFTAVIITAATVVSRTVGRIGTRLPMTIGPLVLSAALFWLSRMSEQTTYVWGILGPILLLGAGAGLIFVPLSLTVMSGTHPRELGLASALLNVGQQVGGSIGLALLGTIAATVTRNQLQTARPTPAAVSHAMISGFGSALEVSTAIMFVGFLIALLVVRGRAPAVAANTLPDAA